MNTATYQYSAPRGLRAYAADVVHAACAFAAALFAAQERRYVAQQVVSGPSRKARSLLRDRNSVLAMANDYERMHPALAAELRTIAGRD